jgi:hypothetical protein
MTDDELIALALEVGFDAPNGTGLDGESELDARVYVQEFPVGALLVKFARAVLGREGLMPPIPSPENGVMGDAPVRPLYGTGIKR